jgi:hypothetical protein
MTSSTGRHEVAFVLLVLQASAGILGALGLLVLMGSPLHAVPALAGPAVQLVLAAFVVRERRWAWALVVAMEILFVYSFVANGALGLLPEVDLTLTLTGLLTRIALPIALICLAILALAAPAARGAPAVSAAPADRGVPAAGAVPAARAVPAAGVSLAAEAHRGAR